MNGRRLATIGIILGVLALGFFTYRNVAQGRGDDPPDIHVEKATEKEKQLRQIMIVGSSTESFEVRYEDDGWVIAAEDKVNVLTAYQIFERCRVFFRDLSDTNVPVKVASFSLKTDKLKDEWGHVLHGEVLARVVFEQESFTRANWASIDPLNIRKIADEIWLHEEIVALVEQEEDRRGQTSSSSEGAAGGESGKDERNGSN